MSKLKTMAQMLYLQKSFHLSYLGTATKVPKTEQCTLPSCMNSWTRDT